MGDLVDKIHNLLSEQDDPTIITDAPASTCPHHPGIVRRIATATMALSFIASGIDGQKEALRRIGKDISDLREAIVDAYKINGKQNVDIAVLRNTLKTELRNKAVLYGLGCSVLTGLIIVGAEFALK